MANNPDHMKLHVRKLRARLAFRTFGDLMKVLDLEFPEANIVVQTQGATDRAADAIEALYETGTDEEFLGAVESYESRAQTFYQRQRAKLLGAQ